MSASLSCQNNHSAKIGKENKLSELGGAQRFSFSVAPFDLDGTLSCGQSFCWKKKEEGSWEGWIAGRPVRVWEERDLASLSKGRTTLEVEAWGQSQETVAEYFQWELDIESIWKTFPQDVALDKARSFCPGLRLLRQDPWETLVCFICSSVKQLAQIEKINQDLRRHFGEELGADCFRFPSAERLAEVGEGELRGVKMGFRAKYVAQAAKQVASGEVDLDIISRLSTDEAREALQKVAGVGEKIANCLLLYGYHRLEAFPIDVWVERVLREIYFAHQEKVSSKELREFAKHYFGKYGGYAQQYLFHWIRNRGDSA